MNADRTIRYIKQQIEETKLDLRGLTVLTECGTNAYMTTPLIALMAGAEKVWADGPSRVTPASNDQWEALTEYGFWADHDPSRLCWVDQRATAARHADIITNLGFVRPIDKWMVSRMKPGAVVPLMYEPWELRNEDVDIEACREKGIPVMGTNEDSVLPYLGHLALKLCYEAGLVVGEQTYTLLGSPRLCEFIGSALDKAGAITRHEADSDFIVLADCWWHHKLIGANGLMSVEDVAKAGATVIHISGDIDKKALLEAGVRVYPERTPQKRHMCVTLDYLGWEPVIKLHTLGLKVGEVMARAVMATGNDMKTAQARAAAIYPALLIEGFVK